MNTVILEDNKEYIILDIIIIEGTNYVYLYEPENEESKNNFCIRKLVDNDENMSRLDSDAEYEKALLVYTEKHKDILTEN